MLCIIIQCCFLSYCLHVLCFSILLWFRTWFSVSCVLCYVILLSYLKHQHSYVRLCCIRVYLHVQEFHHWVVGQWQVDQQVMLQSELLRPHSLWSKLLNPHSLHPLHPYLVGPMPLFWISFLYVQFPSNSLQIFVTNKTCSFLLFFRLFFGEGLTV